MISLPKRSRENKTERFPQRWEGRVQREDVYKRQPYAYAQPGDTISFFDTDTGKWIGTTILESVEVSGNAIAVTLKEELEGIRAGAGCKAIVDSLAAPDSRIQGGDFQGTFRFRSPLYVTDSRLHVTRMWLNAEPPLELSLIHILLDTRSFVMKAGVRTFEAAAYLRKLGADTVEVKRMFSGSMEMYRKKTAIIARAELYKNTARCV